MPLPGALRIDAAHRSVPREAGFHQGEETVVIRSPRGTELGEVLLSLAEESFAGSLPGESLILRTASPLDRTQAAELSRDQPRRLEQCQSIFENGQWPIEVIDAEALLEPGRTVLYYLGPHDLDIRGLQDHFREAFGLSVHLEPVGRDEASIEELAESPDGGGCGTGCGSGGCGSSGGGCGSTDETASGCGGCPIPGLVKSR